MPPAGLCVRVRRVYACWQIAKSPLEWDTRSFPAQCFCFSFHVFLSSPRPAACSVLSGGRWATSDCTVQSGAVVVVDVEVNVHVWHRVALRILIFGLDLARVLLRSWGSHGLDWVPDEMRKGCVCGHGATQRAMRFVCGKL